jgi:hypothetical protein
MVGADGLGQVVSNPATNPFSLEQTSQNLNRAGIMAIRLIAF